MSTYRIGAYWGGGDDVLFADLKGRTILEISGACDKSEAIGFKMENGEEFVLLHCRDCCEGVWVEDVAGDVADILGSPILLAEAVSNGDRDAVNDGPLDEYDSSFTWTFYKLATIKGSITIRWYGTSNGYYSESVEFFRTAAPRQGEEK